MRMRITITILLILSWKIRRADNEICGKPEVSRQLWHIYRIVEKVDVSVYHCFYKHTLHIYSDITKNCIQAFHTSVYTDKWNDNYYVSESSPLKIESYTTKVDVIQNEIVLRSGTICKYDRGFCYDTKESLDYAAVWEVKDKGTDIKDKNLDQIFYGWVDAWTLRNNNLKYLVFQDSKTDRSFAVQLVKKDNVLGKSFWYTEEYGIIASQDSLNPNLKSTPLLNQKYLPLKPKQYVSNHILRSCDLQSFPLDFERRINQDYLSDFNNLKEILALLQEQIIKVKTTAEPTVKGNNENQINNKDVTQFKKDISDLRAFMLVNEITVSELQANLTNTRDVLSLLNKNITRFEENVGKILSQQDTQSVALGKLRDSFTILQNKIQEIASNKKGQDNTEFKNSLSDLKSILLRNDENIYFTLNNTNKEVKGIATDVKNIYSQLKHIDEEFKKERDGFAGRISTLELGLTTQAKDIAKCQVDTNAIITDKERYFLEEQNKLLDKYKEISKQINLHGDQIAKCKNYTDYLLSSRNELVQKVESDIRDLQNTLLQYDIKLKDIQNQNVNITETNSKAGREIEELQKAIRLNTDDITSQLDVNRKSIREIREKSDQCQNNLNKVLADKNEEFVEITNNLTQLQSVLLTQEQEITNLQENVTKSHTIMSLIQQNCTKQMSDWKVYITPRLEDKDDEVTDLRRILLEKEKDIKALYESVKDHQGRIDYLEEKIKKNQEGTDAKVKEKDEAIKRIEYDFTKREEKIQKQLKEKDEEMRRIENELVTKEEAILKVLKDKDETIKRIENDFAKKEEHILRELKDKDKKYEELMKEISKINESMGTVIAV